MNVSPSNIGVIGLGLLGGAIGVRLIDAGMAVVGFDTDAARCDAAGKSGVQIADSAADLARRCDRIVLSLPDSDIVARVVADIELALTPGTTVIDTTTGAPEAAAAVGERLAACGCRFLEANVVGSSDNMRAHDAVLLVGGDADEFARQDELLGTLGRQCFHVGGWGTGAGMKLVVNLVLGLNRAVLAEGLSLAEAFGFEGQKTLEVLMSGLAYSRVMDIKGPKMLAEEFTPQARLAQHLKDVRLMLAAGRDADMPLPLSTAHEELLAHAVGLGYGDADNSAVIKAFRNRPSSK
jgi:3-hydroxyisobutyrate dehydrogenase-like beta-hydroxyacid dehydrogenase